MINLDTEEEKVQSPAKTRYIEIEEQKIPSPVKNATKGSEGCNVGATDNQNRKNPNESIRNRNMMTPRAMGTARPQSRRYIGP